MALILPTNNKTTQLDPNGDAVNIMSILDLWDRFNNLKKLHRNNGSTHTMGVWVLEIASSDKVTLRIDLHDSRHELQIPTPNYYALIKDYDLNSKLSTLESVSLAEAITKIVHSFYDEHAPLLTKGTSPTMDALASLGAVSEEVKGEVDTLGDALTHHLPLNHSATHLHCDPTQGAKHLEEATQLYEPVFGTNKGSRYHVVLITDYGTKVAARYKGNTFSLRAILPDNNDPSNLRDLGLSSSSKGHYSVHYSPCTKEQAQRTLGALIGMYHPDTILTGLPVLSVFSSEGV